MRGLRITIGGDGVQGVAYKIHLLWLAESLDIERFQATNVGKEVEVLVSGDRGQLTTFVELVKTSRPPHAKVERINVEEYEGPIPTTEAYYRLLSLEQLAKIVNSGISLLDKQDKMLEKQDMMLEKQDRMLEKQDKMLEKQDKMLENQEKMLKNQEKMLENQEKMLSKMDSMLGRQGETLSEIQMLRKDLREILDKRLTKIERDVERIKNILGLT